MAINLTVSEHIYLTLKSPFMKLHVLIVLVFGSVLPIRAQFTGFGIQPKINFSRQLIVDNALPATFAKQETNRSASLGLDLFVDYALADRFNLRGKAGFESKGFSKRFWSVNQYMISFNRFKYVSVDILGRYDFALFENTRLYANFGISAGYLYKKMLISTGSVPFPNVLEKATELAYSPFNLGGIVGLGCSFGDALWLEVDWNRDILAPAKADELKVYNSVFAVNIGINILGMIQNVKTS